jgi:hypothetical protein
MGQQPIGKFVGTKGAPKGIKYPGNDTAKPPGKGFVWMGNGDVESNRGMWVNPTTKEAWRPDLHHPPPIGPHWDYWDADGHRYRVYEDNTVEPV